MIGYGGSEAIQSPKALYSDVAKGLVRALGVEIDRFETAFDRDLYPSLGLSRGVFFLREAFGVDKLVTGDPMWGGDGVLAQVGEGIRALAAFGWFGGVIGFLVATKMLHLA